MAELALRTQEVINHKAKYTAWRPVGSVIISINQHQMRRKWLEIVCDLVSPKKRDNYKNISGWQYLCDHWTPQLREEWIQLQKPNKEYPHGALLQNIATAQSMWDQRVDAQLISLVGKEPIGVKDKTDTWLWSDDERKIYFITVNEDEEDLSKVQGWQGFNNITDSGNLYIMPRTQIKYQTDIPELSAETLIDIADRDKILHPRFDKPITKTKINSPSILELNTSK